MLKQIEIMDALERVMDGERIKCMVPCKAKGDEWNEMIPGFLNDILHGVICFADDEPEEDITEPEVDPEDKGDEEAETFMSLPDPDQAEDDQTAHRTRKRVDLDIGKIMALHRAKWSNKQIAEEMGVSVATIQRYVAANRECDSV